ncbi:hypothetical protein D3C71_2184350 [compost metagenome]
MLDGFLLHSFGNDSAGMNLKELRQQCLRLHPGEDHDFEIRVLLLQKLANVRARHIGEQIVQQYQIRL